MNCSELLAIASDFEAEDREVMIHGLKVIVTLFVCVLMFMVAFAILSINATLHRMEARAMNGVEPEPEPLKETHSLGQVLGQPGYITILSNYRDDYRKADGNDRRIIAQTVRHEFANVSEHEVPADLRDFLATMRRRKPLTRLHL